MKKLLSLSLFAVMPLVADQPKSWIQQCTNAAFAIKQSIVKPFKNIFATTVMAEEKHDHNYNCGHSYIKSLIIDEENQRIDERREEIRLSKRVEMMRQTLSEKNGRILQEFKKEQEQARDLLKQRLIYWGNFFSNYNPFN